ncbi:hypothetical protein M4I21_18395 [Cellulophaga sp. 20_2_10]|uniref:hypothetical protein n=1 Tax=Cellulophaga sp. 20_2_10 TaxID=2942476 RepID=UPI00201A6657|nr:hypothetical protein [Cellulophaga sp. 20_2_10]MCL5247783.1 hypothetical protein [Cellulophaga sp. 20_2_10]
MKYLPYEKYTFETTLDKEEVFRRISENLEPEQTFRSLWSNKQKPYEGKINGNTFRMKRLIRYRNSFLPVLIATVESRGEKNILNVKMRLMHFVLGFMTFWMSGVLLGLIAFGAKSIMDEFTPVVLVPFGMLLFGYLLTTLAFKYESKKYKYFIEELLELKEKTTYNKT